MPGVDMLLSSNAILAACLSCLTQPNLILLCIILQEQLLRQLLTESQAYGSLLGSGGVGDSGTQPRLLSRLWCVLWHCSIGCADCVIDQRCLCFVIGAPAVPLSGQHLHVIGM